MRCDSHGFTGQFGGLMGSSVWDAKTIFAAIAAAAAVGSAAVSVVSVRTARRTLALAQQQDARRSPRIVSYLRDGFTRREQNRRLYAVSMSLTNPSDTDNSVAMLELEIRYRIRDGVLMTIRLAHETALAEAFGRPDIEALKMQLLIPAHGTVAGWTFFALPAAAIGDAAIDDYSVRLVDAHGIATMIELGPVRDIRGART
jgi:hypothetical protein